MGVTHDDPQRRFARHLSNARKSCPRYHSGKWIASLLRDDTTPVIQIIDQGTGDWEAAEVSWISIYKQQGHALTNHAEGGRGPIGCHRSQETRDRLRAANLGKKQSLEVVEKRIAPLRGRCLTDEMKAAISAANTGKIRSDKVRAAMREMRSNPTWRARVSESNKRTWAAKKAAGEVPVRAVKPVSENTRQKLRASHTGKRPSEETRAKMRASQRAAWAKRRSEGGSQ